MDKLEDVFGATELTERSAKPKIGAAMSATIIVTAALGAMWAVGFTPVCACMMMATIDVMVSEEQGSNLPVSLDQNARLIAVTLRFNATQRNYVNDSNELMLNLEFWRIDSSTADATATMGQPNAPSPIINNWIFGRDGQPSFAHQATILVEGGGHANAWMFVAFDWVEPMDLPRSVTHTFYYDHFSLENKDWLLRTELFIEA